MTPGSGNSPNLSGPRSLNESTSSKERSSKLEELEDVEEFDPVSSSLSTSDVGEQEDELEREGLIEVLSSSIGSQSLVSIFSSITSLLGAIIFLLFSLVTPPMIVKSV